MAGDPEFMFNVEAGRVCREIPFVVADRGLHAFGFDKLPKRGCANPAHELEEAVELSDRLVFLGERPARIVLEREPLVARSQRDRTTVSTLARQLTAKVVLRR